MGAGLSGILLVVHAAAETEPPFRIEDEDVGCRLGTVAPRHGLRLAIVEIREGEVPLAGANDHLLQAVREIGIAQLVEPYHPGIVGREATRATPLGR
jgi:hypothetical protein